MAGVELKISSNSYGTDIYTWTGSSWSPNAHWVAAGNAATGFGNVTTTWTYSVSVDLNHGATYYIVSRARDRSGNYDVLITNSCGNATSARAPFWRSGDMNCDGVVNFKDINPFVAYLSDFSNWQTTYAGCSPQNGDVNGDGTYPSFKDINPFVALLSGG